MATIPDACRNAWREQRASFFSIPPVHAAFFGICAVRGSNASVSGGLEGAQDSVKWEMIRYIVITARHNHGRYQALLHQLGIPTIELSNTREIARFYQSEGLER
jgi:hypothetical protein